MSIQKWKHYNKGVKMRIMKKQYNIYIDEEPIERLDNMIKHIQNESSKKWSRGEIIATLIAIYGKGLEDYLIDCLKL